MNSPNSYVGGVGKHFVSFSTPPASPLAKHLTSPNRILGDEACGAQPRSPTGAILLCDLQRPAAPRTPLSLRVSRRY